ncbi:hypothetical protein FOZ63_023442, partial [Perkinsus olseni]
RLQSSGHPVKNTKSRLARPMTGRALYQATVGWRREEGANRSISRNLELEAV